MKEVQLEEIGKTVIVKSGKKIVFIHVGYDEDSEDPTKWDGMGKIHSLSNRHINSISSGDAQDLVYPMECPSCGNSCGEEFEDVGEKMGHKVYVCGYCGKFSVACRVEQESDCVILGYFEHGNCIWHVTGEIPRGTEGDYRWDGVRVAGVWEPDKYILEAAETLGLEPGSADRQRWMEKQARSACETYTAWCNGWVYWYSLSIYKARQHNGHILKQRDDYRFDDPLYDQGCGGFYDTDHLAEDINNELKYGKVKVMVSI